jgi:hypothetical protein
MGEAACKVCDTMSRTTRQAQGYGWLSTHNEAGRVCHAVRNQLSQHDLPSELLLEALQWPVFHAILAENPALPLALMTRPEALQRAFIVWCKWKGEDPDEGPHTLGPQTKARVQALFGALGLAGDLEWAYTSEARVLTYGLSAAALTLRVLWAAAPHAEEIVRWPLAFLLPWPTSEPIELVELARARFWTNPPREIWNPNPFIPDLEQAWQRLLEGPPLDAAIEGSIA